MADLSADINDRPPSAASRKPTRAGDETAIVALIELLFFAYRDFTGKPDEILAEYGFGRAHHRILHFVDRHPGLRVADLLDILKITKQSLARVLRQLVSGGFIEQKSGPSDRRERRLYTTPSGKALARRLVEPQIARIRSALGGAHEEARPDVVEAFLFAMIEPAERKRVETLLRAAMEARQCP